MHLNLKLCMSSRYSDNKLTQPKEQGKQLLEASLLSTVDGTDFKCILHFSFIDKNHL